jgi:glycosyltransferase involved in cell wall biosynthesis
MESEAISCIEAFATGLVPVISNSNLSATKQFALDERSLFEAGDPQDLARAIDYWLDNPEEKHRMEKIYSESAAKYNINNSITQFEAMLQEAIADNKK